jgi:hypothetical protein
MSKKKTTAAIATKKPKSKIKEFSEMLHERTMKWFVENDLLDSKKAKKYSQKAKEFDKIISKASFGCQETAVRQLIEKLIDEKLIFEINK